MVNSCAAYNCTTRFSKLTAVPFHSFPKDKDLRKKWILATRRENFMVTAASKLCGKHFRSDDYVESTALNARKRLKKCAVPSIFDFPRHLLKKQTVKLRGSKVTNLPSSKPSSSTCSAVSEPFSQMLEVKADGNSKIIKRKRYIYPGDFSLSDMKNAKKARLMFKIATKQLGKRSAVIKNLQKVNKRLLNRVRNLRDLLDHLKKSNKISLSCFSILKLNTCLSVESH